LPRRNLAQVFEAALRMRERARERALETRVQLRRLPTAAPASIASVSTSSACGEVTRSTNAQRWREFDSLRRIRRHGAAVRVSRFAAAETSPRANARPLPPQGASPREGEFRGVIASTRQLDTVLERLQMVPESPRFRSGELAVVLIRVANRS
jgi:hypothetical protein